MVLGGTITNDSTYDSLSLNKMLNIYPLARGFTAIGSGEIKCVSATVPACSTEDTESEINHQMFKKASKDEYIHDLYAVKDDEDTSSPFPLLQHHVGGCLLIRGVEGV
ncbi:uncharacterized protein LOC122196216 [Lactuca sativa]|uniref:uncharacterized protein LOC122196216 n=1 Tax=Lactuca sativa TaxID=4236 RepID=UPI001C68DF9B|nr:uncharacterized protein LOC122196216 [Lactuca sativa]XP_042754553.1 uncharacterized protein LOC122196216 [Lactuca sativa]XP_042754554.1 uncharacterized protein LOC122196216 [Lactuca sativa]XP_042754555.1 uncharacterized protein LOC122196216 [Lactuca sativa]